MYKAHSMLLGLGLMAMTVLSVTVQPVTAGPLPKTIVLGANTPGSLYYVMSAGFAKAISDHTPMKVEVFPQGGTVWYPMLESGEVNFGIQVPGDILAAYKGEGIYKSVTNGKGFALRTLMLGSPLKVALLVRGNSPIKKPSDLKGKRVVMDYGAFYSATLTMKALLANYGLSEKDVKSLSVTTYVDGVRALMEGRADVSFGSLGSGIVEELNTEKGARYLPLETSPEAIARMKTVHPGYYPIFIKPGITGVTQKMAVMGKDITLIASQKLPDEVAYAITKALWENYKEYAPIHPMLKAWTTDRFASVRAVIPYHPGSIRFYKEKGVWTKELEAHQEELMKIK